MTKRFGSKVQRWVNTLKKRHLVQLDGFDTNKTKKTKWAENTEKRPLQQNDFRNKVMVKN